MSRLQAAMAAKLAKRQALEAHQINVHPYFFAKQLTLAQVRATELATVVQTAGRIFSVRPHGKVIFMDLGDGSGRVQLMFRQQELKPADWEVLNLIDSGDFLGVKGELTNTKTGELTILIQNFQVLGKALRPLPTAWNKADDKEIRFRQRYLDMLIDPQVKKILDTRWQVEKEIRRYLEDQYQFVEVETPVLQPLYGGTNAKPFTTHMNALDADLYLRIAPELYLKRLIVGGYDRIFEIARNFRNEGIDQTHQPEFTMIEWYHAYADYQLMMEVAEGLIKHLAEQITGGTKLAVGETKIDLAGEWPKITMVDALRQFAGLDWPNLSTSTINKLLAEHQLEIKGESSPGKILFVLFDKLVTPQLIQPTWIIDYPRAVSPLAKQHRLQPDFAERFEGYIGGKEITDGWSEIVDPIDQRQLFSGEQQNLRAGDDEAHPLDEDFLTAMEYGMPPLGGIGMGIDRLVMFLTNTWSIREVIAFPTLKPKNNDQLANKNDAEKKHPVAKPIMAPVSAVTKAAKAATETVNSDSSLPPRSQAEQLLAQFIKEPSLRHHCEMVATALAAYAQKLGQDEELWYQAGLLHDLDWEMYPDEHPNRAINEILANYPAELKTAIAAHAPQRTGVNPTSLLDKYLFACDELSGFLHAISLVRPAGYNDLAYKSVKKKLKDKAFAANVSRADIAHGFELIGLEPADHVEFLISVFKKI